MLAGLVLAGCMSTQPTPYISEKARAALKPGTDLSTVWRRDDGCYFIQTRDELTGYLIMVRDETGRQVCDDV
ncbi:hypothetical protein [Actibacterium sp. XHP0104]|uniref:hypothetical protein n=1 Tax=Actibacterium sp. XHP0104 TaxID=2984335 RepID=UPI0021E816F9|nr:hypothetical protein [Actibacterium sp. XHP0104]MCV2880652.1 hypothetical protein [Actibacterium sp. XHP0104]